MYVVRQSGNAMRKEAGVIPEGTRISMEQTARLP